MLVQCTITHLRKRVLSINACCPSLTRLVRGWLESLQTVGGDRILTNVSSSRPFKRRLNPELCLV